MQFDLQSSHHKVKIHKHQKYPDIKESDKYKLNETKHKDQYYSSDSGSSVNKHKSTKKETIDESQNVYHKLNKLLEDIGMLSDSSRSSGERRASIISIKSEILTDHNDIDKPQNDKFNAANFKKRPNGEHALNLFNLPTKKHSKKKIIHTYNETETRPQLYTFNDSLEHTKIKKKKKRHQTDSESDIAKKESKNKKKHAQIGLENDNKKRFSDDSDHIKIKKKNTHQTDPNLDNDILTKNTGNELMEDPLVTPEKDVKKKKKREINSENNTEIDSRNHHNEEQSYADSYHSKIKKKKKHHSVSSTDTSETVSTNNTVDNEKESSATNSVELLKNETKIKKKKKHSTENLKSTVNDNSNHKKTKKKREKAKLEENSSLISFLGDENTFDYDAIKDRLEINDSRLSEQQKGMLSQLVVELPWPVAPSHLVETRMSTHPLKSQQEIFKNEFNMQTTSTYTSEEDNRIIRNWNKFCELHLIPNDPEPFLAFEAVRNSKLQGSVLSKSQRINFVRFLGHRLPHRYLYSIYRRFKKLFSKNIKGKFSAAEDDMILNYTQQSQGPNKFAQLAVILNRDRHAILLRHKTLQRDKKRKENSSVSS